MYSAILTLFLTGAVIGKFFQKCDEEQSAFNHQETQPLAGVKILGVLKRITWESSSTTNVPGNRTWTT
jgi:hypothetical protein